MLALYMGGWLHAYKRHSCYGLEIKRLGFDLLVEQFFKMLFTETKQSN